MKSTQRGQMARSRVLELNIKSRLLDSIQTRLSRTHRSHDQQMSDSEFPTGCFFGADELEIPLEQDKRRRRRPPASSGRRKKRRTANNSDQEDSDNDDPTNPTTGTHDNVVCCAIYSDKNILGFCTYDDDRSKLLVSSTEIDTNNLSQPKYQSHIKRALTLYVQHINPSFIVLSSQVDSFIHDVCLSLFSGEWKAFA